MNKLRSFSWTLAFLLFGPVIVLADPPSGKDWELVFEDHFDYPDEQLDQNWNSQNGPMGHIMSSRWRENAVVSDGTLKLVARKENRGGQEWTAGSLWTRQLWRYGYFECRYKYAASTGTNNSFWIMTHRDQEVPEDEGVKRFEIDINEGKYPDAIHLNLHNHTDQRRGPSGRMGHPAWPTSIYLTPNPGARPDHEIVPEAPVRTTKLRLTTDQGKYFHLRTLRALAPRPKGYPNVLTDAVPQGVVDHARSAKISHTPTHPKYGKGSGPEKVIDGKVGTSWIAASQPEISYELDWDDEAKEIGCIQFVSGWWNNLDGKYVHFLKSYRVEYWDLDQAEWVELASLEKPEPQHDLSQEFHTYGLEWNQDELVYYFDGKEIHRIKNHCAHYDAPVWLSLALSTNYGPLGPQTDGAAMEIDYVKIWQEVEPSLDSPVVEGR